MISFNDGDVNVKIGIEGVVYYNSSNTPTSYDLDAYGELNTGEFYDVDDILVRATYRISGKNVVANYTATVKGHNVTNGKTFTKSITGMLEV